MEFEISAIFVIEVLGRPAEHVASALEQLIESLGREENVQISSRKIYPPKQTEKTQNMFLAFAEVELKANALARIAELCFVYMPSSVEIIKPYDLKMTLNDANAILNLLVARLHNYDAIAKRMVIENTILQNQLKQAGIIDLHGEEKAEQKQAARGKRKKQQKIEKPRKKKQAITKKKKA